MLPKVRFATYGLPTGFFLLRGKKQVVYARKIDSCNRLYVTTWHGYLASGSHNWFAVILCHLASLRWMTTDLSMG